VTPEDPTAYEGDGPRGPTARVRAERTLGTDDAGTAKRRRGAASVLVPAIAVAALVALVAALSGGLPGRVRGSGAGLSAQALLGDAAAIVLALALGAVCFVIYDACTSRERIDAGGVRRRRRRRWRLPRLSLDPASMILALVVFAVVALILAIAVLIGGSRGAPAGALATAGTTVAPTHHAAPAASGGGNIPANGLIFAIVASLLALAGIWLALREQGRRRAAVPASASDELAAAVEESLEDLGSEPDPRRAVIKAYDRMERALTASGTPRDRAETPLEYLRRALAAVNASKSSIRRLTDLFEQARFSRHVIDAMMKQEAIEALTALRSELHGLGGAA
jgi:Domain of unknown function (DUF4129)